MNLHSAILFAASLGLQAVSAATITVTNPADSGPGTLRAALLAASDGDTINFALLTPAKITLTSGELAVTKGVSILGPGPSNLLVDGSHQSRIFFVTTSSAVVISGLTITNGNSRTGPVFEGGGLYNQGSTLTVSNCVLVGNASVRGGGIFNQYGTVHVVRSILRGNLANNGGGIANSAGTVVVTQCTISTNTANPDAFGASGGGIYNECDGSDVARARLAIVDSTIEGNLSGQGGGISNVAIDGSTELGITNSTISGNSALCHDPTVDCTGLGGGMYHEAILSADPTTVYVVNSTFAGNISAWPGTGIFFGNFVPADGRLVIASSIFESGRSNGPILNISALPGSGLTSLGHNVCRDSGSGFLTNATDQINTDPMLGPLQDNGGPTFTHAPLPGSPAIDKGRNLSDSTTDQRGFPRTVNVAGISNAVDGDGADVGAVESQDVGLRLVNSSVVSNRFGFNLIGPFSSAVVEGSTSLSNWTALATNILTDAPMRFSDPSSEPSRRFYRAHVQ